PRRRPVPAQRGTPGRPAFKLFGAPQWAALAPFGELLLHGQRKVDGRAADLVAIVAKEEKVALKPFPKPFQNTVPFRARTGIEFVGNDVGQGANAFAGAADGEQFRADAKLRGAEDENGAAEREEVQEEPEQDFGVERKTRCFHRAGRVAATGTNART